MKQEGPKLTVIPAQQFLSCHGCDFHKSKLWASGRNPTYHHNCMHPEFHIKPSESFGNLHPDEDDQIKTPYSCPFLKDKEGNGYGFSGHGTSGMFMKTQIDYDGPAKNYEP